MPAIQSSSCKFVHVQSFRSVRQTRCLPTRHCVQASRESSIQRSVKSSQAQASSRLPRFYCETPLPDVVGSSLQLSATESKHATRVLRLKDNTLVEVCDGQGQIVTGKLVTTAKAAAHIVTTTPSQQVSWEGCKWELAVACGSLQSSRADWLLEKCTELGAWSFRPILSDRSPGIGWKGVGKTNKGSGEADGYAMERGAGRFGRWRRIADAASKQSLRAHHLILQPAMTMSEFSAHVAAAPSAWVGAAGGSPLRDQGLAPLVNIQPDRETEPRLLIIGPEGDFTMAELNLLTHHGAQLVSLGCLRLRVETAALAMLSAAQLLI
ncbi:TPA: hypothetical protein ACH3X1_007335 [Trebouxia sp. C0004]